MKLCYKIIKFDLFQCKNNYCFEVYQNNFPVYAYTKIYYKKMHPTVGDAYKKLNKWYGYFSNGC
jgi:hypothetical protein